MKMKMSDFAQMKFEQGYSASEVWNIICTHYFGSGRNEEVFRQNFLGLHAHKLM